MQITANTHKQNLDMKKTLLPILAFVASLGSMAQKVHDVPYEQTFDSQSAMYDFITIDANDDGESWSYNPVLYCARCSYCNEQPVDDYLLLAIRLDAHAAYELTFNCYGGFFDDTFDLWLADAPTVEGMKTRLLEPTALKNVKDNYVHRVNFSVETSGVYYIAWHDCSAKDQGTIFLDNIKLEGSASTAPSAPEFLCVVPGDKGNRICDLTFTLPTTTLDGKPLDNIASARIYRNDILVETLRKDAEGNALQPGATCTWHDKELSNRLYTYKVVAQTSDGSESAPAVREVYVGIDTPGRVSNLQFREDINEPGKVILTWDAPTVGIHGGYLDPKRLTYTISKSYNDEPVTSETHYEAYVDISKGQTYVAYSIYAQNEVGSNRSDWQTISTHVGPAMPSPWSESYPNVSCKNGPWLSHVTGTTEIGDASWYVSSPVGNIPAQDDDGGYTYFFTSAVGKSARYTSPKIAISNLSTPTLSFWLYEKGNADVIEVGVLPEMTEWETLANITLDGEGWKRHTVDLTPYLDRQFIQVGFNGISVEETDHITAIDNIAIRNYAERDVAIQHYDFPARVDIGHDNAFTLTLRNRGAEDLAEGSYSVNLYRKDADATERRLVAAVDGPALKADMNDVITLKDCPDVFTSAEVQYSAEVVMDGDATPADNIVDPVDVVVFKPAYPVPTLLAGDSRPDALDLSWTAPDVSEGSALPVTESFEDYPIFSITDCGEWKLYDGDGQITLTMALSTGDDVITLDYEHVGEPMAWQVFSPIDAGIPYTSWDPHSGELMMVAMGNSKNPDDQRYHDNDDWLISPELSGREQSISFFAKCGMGTAYQPEQLEVLYSTTDTDPASFKPVDDVIQLYNVSQWEEHIATLPEGARYFALRCVSEHKFALLLDDVTYHPAGSADLTLLGYNVYRDRVLMNDALLPTPCFADATAESGHTYEYCVTAVYKEGESIPSAPYVVLYDPNGIAHITTDGASAGTYDLLGRRATASTTGVVVKRKTKMIMK